MRILALDLGAGRRGGQGQTLLASAALAARGHDLAVAGRTGSPLAADVREAGLVLMSVSHGSEASPGVLLDVARAVRRHRPDVLWASDARGHGAAVWSRASRRRPLAVTRRVVFPPRLNPLSSLKYAAARRYFAVSRAVERTLLDAGIPASRVALLPDGLPPEAFVAAEAPAAPPFRLVHVGSFDGKKGQRLVVDVVAALVRSGYDAVVLFLGDGPLRPAVEEEARRAGVFDRCTFAGSVRDVPWRLAASHLLLLPSESEGAPLALVEAMAAGCPVLAHDIGGAGEMADGGGAGRLLHSLDPGAWTEAVIELMENTARLDELRAAGRRAAAERTIARTAAAMEEAFEAMVRS